MEGQETDPRTSTIGKPHQMLVCLSPSPQGQNQSPRSYAPDSFAHLLTYSRLLDSRAQRLWAATTPLLYEPLGNQK